MPIRIKILFLIALVSCIFFFSCSSREKKYLIPKDDLTGLIVDIHIADAIGYDYPLKRKYNIPDSAALYASVFEKHGYTKEQFDSTLSYYVNRPEELNKIYQKVFARLSKREDELRGQDPGTDEEKPD